MPYITEYAEKAFQVKRSWFERLFTFNPWQPFKSYKIVMRNVPVSRYVSPKEYVLRKEPAIRTKWLDDEDKRETYRQAYTPQPVHSELLSAPPRRVEDDGFPLTQLSSLLDPRIFPEPGVEPPPAAPEFKSGGGGDFGGGGADASWDSGSSSSSNSDSSSSSSSSGD